MKEAPLVTADWSERRLKTVAELRTSNVDKNSSEHEQPVRLCNYTDVYYSSIIDDPSDFMKATATHAEIRRFRLRRGDVLITKDSETAGDIAVPAHVTRDFDDVLCGYHLAILRPRRDIVGRYLYYALLTGRVRDQFSLGANGITRFGLSQSAINDVRVPVPDLDTQRAIASFLDRETARIDTLIEKKRRLLDLLEEKRTALITRAVTRGLDTDVPMKDSGVESLGDIPASWKVARLGRLAAVGNGSTPSRSTPEYWRDGDIPWLTSGMINKGVITGADQFVTRDALRDCHLPMVPNGSVLIAITGEGQTRGRAALLKSEATISQHLAYLAPRSADLLAGYLWRFLQSQYDWLRYESSSSGSTRAALTCGFLKEVALPLPPIHEQRAIADWIDQENKQVNELVAATSEAVHLLSEYRTALISAAVTGRVDVKQPAVAPA